MTDTEFTEAELEAKAVIGLLGRDVLTESYALTLRAHARAIDALRESVKSGAHDGPCDNEYQIGSETAYTDEACTLHLAAAKRRREEALDVIEDYDKENPDGR